MVSLMSNCVHDARGSSNMARISGSTANSSVGLFGSYFDFSWEVAANGHKIEITAAKQSIATADAGGLRGIDLSQASFIRLGLFQLLYKISLFPRQRT